MTAFVPLVAISTVRLDGRSIAPGTPFEATSTIADRLVALKAAERTESDDGPALPAPGTPERAAAIADAVTKLADADWTGGGTPKVAAVEQALGNGWTVTAAELAGFKPTSDA